METNCEASIWALLKTMYDSLVLPNIIYGVEIYFGAPDYNLERVIIIQKDINRSTRSIPYNTHT